MKTREITLDDGFRPYPNGIHPKLEEQAAKKAEAVAAKNPFEELEKDKYKGASPFFSKPETEKPVLNLGGNLEEARRTPVEEEIEDAVKEEITEEIPEAKASHDLDPNWVRQELPSKCRPYTFKEVFLRTLTIPTLGVIHAARVKNSFTILLDALNQCISVDIRELTPPDLTFVMHWIIDNSYPKSSMKIKYTTRYGNKIEIPIRTRNLAITELAMTEEEYQKWSDRGFTFPKVRDMELLFGDAVPIDTRWLLDYAQYVEADIDPKEYHNYTQLKIDALTEMGLGAIVEIDEFSELIKHGVEETVTITDPNFNPVKAAEFFDEQAKKMLATIAAIPLEDREDLAVTIIEIGATAEEMMNEAADIRKALAEGIKVEAQEEVVAVRITATDFFPTV